MIKKVAVVVYRMKNGRPLFFVAKRNDRQGGVWQYVTGHVEAGEPSTQTVIRELNEELGSVRILNLIHLKKENRFVSESGKKYHEKIFAVEISEVKKLQKEEFQQYEWLKESEAIARVDWPSHKESIKATAEIIRRGKYPKIFIVCAPGGAGKDTIIERILEKFEFVRPKTYTTRQLREDGKEWRIHVCEKLFKEMDKNGKFIESNFFGGYWYATPKEFIENAIIDGRNVIVEIDLNGLRSFKTIYSNVVSFFIHTDLEYLEKRLRNRGCHDEGYIETRMKIAKEEIENSNICDYIIKNEEGKLDEAVSELSKKIKEEIY